MDSADNIIGRQYAYGPMKTPCATIATHRDISPEYRVARTKTMTENKSNTPKIPKIRTRKKNTLKKHKAFQKLTELQQRLRSRAQIQQS